MVRCCNSNIRSSVRVLVFRFIYCIWVKFFRIGVQFCVIMICSFWFMCLQWLWNISSCCFLGLLIRFCISFFLCGIFSLLFYRECECQVFFFSLMMKQCLEYGCWNVGLRCCLFSCMLFGLCIMVISRFFVFLCRLLVKQCCRFWLNSYRLVCVRISLIISSIVNRLMFRCCWIDFIWWLFWCSGSFGYGGF